MSDWMLTGGRVADWGWSALGDSRVTRETGDPLGIRAWANQIAAVLAPGLTNATSSAQGYGLLCAGLEIHKHHAVRDLGPSETWLRLERLWVFAQTAHARHAPNSGLLSWPGRRQAARFVDLGRCDLTTPLLGSQLSMGAWGQYRRSAAILGLIKARSAGRGTTPDQVNLTGTHGRQVAHAWRRHNIRNSWTALQISKVLASGEIDVTTARSIFGPDRAHCRLIPKVLSRAIEARDVPGLHLKALRHVWDEADSLEPEVLVAESRLLAAPQSGLPEQAAAVVRLFDIVERPYRSYLRTGSEPPPRKSVWSDPAWCAAEGRAADIVTLRQWGSSTPGSWTGVEKWAGHLAERRGVVATKPGQAPPGYDLSRPPEMSLRALAALFSQGVLGKRSASSEHIAVALDLAKQDEDA
jgi:hypothetical protein